MRATTLAVAFHLAAGLLVGAAAADDDDDVMPDPFYFVDQAGVTRNTQITSASVIITGPGELAPISVTGGKYSIGCNNKFTAKDGTIDEGQSVCVRHTSADGFASDTDTTLTVGGVADTFTSTTLPGDVVTDLFKFIDVVDALMNTLQVSNTVTPGGFDGTAPIEVTGGEYSIGCTAAFTAAPGVIASGEGVCVRHMSASAHDTATATTLTVGDAADTFTSTTPARLNLTHTGAFGAPAMLALLAMLALRGARGPHLRQPR